jgi:hypothetical protein
VTDRAAVHYIGLHYAQFSHGTLSSFVVAVSVAHVVSQFVSGVTVSQPAHVANTVLN